MTYKLLDGRIVEDENDERLTKKFGNTYSYFKNQHPDLYKLPEEEVGEICRRYNQNPYGDTHEKAVARTNNYINNQMPRWQQQYFNKPRQTRTTCAWGTIEQPKAPKQTQPMMTTFSGKPLKQHSLADLDGTKEMYKQMSFKPAPAPKPAAQPKAPQMTPMPQMQTPTPWATGLMTMSQPVSYTQTQPMGFAQMANNATSQSSNPVLNFINSISPTYAAFDTLGILYNAKREMDRRRSNGLDNYYHRLGMCEVGQQAPYNSFYPLMGVLGGVAKESYDVFKKTKDGMPLSETLTDSYKDMKNKFRRIKLWLESSE